LLEPKIGTPNRRLILSFGPVYRAILLVYA